MKRSGRVRAPAAFALVLASLAGMASGGCSSSDPSRSNASAAKSYCDTLTEKQKSCGLRNDGKTDCVNYGDAAEECETGCVAAASCLDLTNYNCSGNSPTMIACMARCVGLLPFVCGDGSTMSPYSRCDGSAQCADGSDEADCDVTGGKCRNVDQFVATSQFCDGVEDCADGSDETPDCAIGLTCSVGGVATPIPLYEICNGKSECDDGSDEPANCSYLMCF